MFPGGGGQGQGALGGRGPPRWNPSMQSRLPFREWSHLVMLWSMTCPDHPSRKAAAVVLVLGGTAQRLALSIPPQAMIHGGQVNGVAVDALTFLLHTLSPRGLRR